MILQAEPKVYAPNQWLEDVIKVRKQNIFKKWLFARKLDKQFYNISPSGTFMHLMAETIELAGMYFMYNNDKENSPILPTGINRQVKVNKKEKAPCHK